MSDFLSIFNPDWWMSENNNALQMTDAVLFLLLSLPVLYLFVYALASLKKYKNPYPKAKKESKFLILFFVSKKGREVIESVNYFLETQQYPRDKYDIAVAATQVSQEDLNDMYRLPITIIVPDKEVCSKIYAIQQVMERYSPRDYDAILILDSDNRIMPDALIRLNDAYYTGCDAIQVHRMAENLNTPLAVLSATSEEINNRLFRKAHTTLGFSSALIGSGMLFDFEMFHRIAPNLKGTDLTKSMELELLKENIYTEYLEDIICYCKKSSDASGYTQERQSWLGAQMRSTVRSFFMMPSAVLQGKWDLAEKLFQWLMPSRLFLIAYIVICAVGMTYMNWPLSIKWYVLLACLGLAFLMALPDGEINRKFRRSLWYLPFLIIAAVFSIPARIFRRGKK